MQKPIKVRINLTIDYNLLLKIKNTPDINVSEILNNALNAYFHVKNSEPQDIIFLKKEIEEEEKKFRENEALFLNKKTLYETLLKEKTKKETEEYDAETRRIAAVATGIKNSGILAQESK